MRHFLQPVGDSAQQDVTTEAFGWRRLIETPPLIAQTFDRKAIEPYNLGGEVQ
jgi:hypothetical protein